MLKRPEQWNIRTCRGLRISEANKQKVRVELGKGDYHWEKNNQKSSRSGQKKVPATLYKKKAICGGKKIE